MKKIILIIALFAIDYVANAQDVLSRRQQADKLFERFEYSKSLKLYLQIAENNDDVHIAERVGDCYRMMNNYENAEEWYKLVALNPKADFIYTLYYAEMLLRNRKITEAAAQFNAYYHTIGDARGLQFKLAACDSAAKWMEQAPYFRIKNEEMFNSGYSDWGLNYFGSNGFVFTSDRKSAKEASEKNTYAWTGNAYFKLYETRGNKIVILPINTKGNTVFKGDYHAGPMAVNANADTAYITITTNAPSRELPVDKKAKGVKQKLYTRRLQLVIATKVNGEWSNFTSFPYNNIKAYSLGHAALSKNGKLIYFTSDMPGGEGKTDIWYCEKQSNGTWGRPINCGKAINTNDEEAFPTLDGDDVLYFASKGLPGMGGFDIFRAKGEKSTWKTPQNLKYPINSTSDDFYLTSRDGYKGYFSSNREGATRSDDIYSFTYQKPDTTDLLTKNAAGEPDTIINHLPLPTDQIKKGQTYVLHNILYDLDKSYIRHDAAAQLNKVLAVLKAHPTLRIELSSHTDCRASDNYNMALSIRRAASAVAYLVQRGISPDRLNSKGYGETRLLNKCADGVKCSEAEHQLNRRTEIRILNE